MVGGARRLVGSMVLLGGGGGIDAVDAGAEAAEKFVGDGCGGGGDRGEVVGKGHVAAYNFDLLADAGERFGKVGHVDRELVHADPANDGRE